MKLEQVHPKIIQVEHLQGFYKKIQTIMKSRLQLILG